MMSIAYFSVKMAPCSSLGYNTDIRNKSFDRALPLCSKITFVFLFTSPIMGNIYLLYKAILFSEKKKLIEPLIQVIGKIKYHGRCV